MKKEDMILDKILRIAIGKQVPESKFFDLTDKNDLSILQYSKLCEMLTMRGYDIVPDDKIISFSNEDNSIIEEKNLEQIDAFSPVINEFCKLSLTNKYKCLVKLASIIAEEDQHTQKAVAMNFIKKIDKMSLQYSYIAVFLKAFFDKCNAMGQAKLNDIIDFFDEYYNNRLEKGLVSEQDDSVLGRKGFNKNDIRKTIIFNPLKRSFLMKYFDYDRLSELVYINEFLWDILSNSEKMYITGVCDEKLENYFNRLAKQ